MRVPCCVVDNRIGVVFSGRRIFGESAISPTKVRIGGETYHAYLPVVVRDYGGASTARTEASRWTSHSLPSSSDTFGGILTPGETLTHTFAAAGDFPYFMVGAPQYGGRVVVQGAAATATPTATATQTTTPTPTATPTTPSLPPDPGTVAPPVDPGAATNLGAATTFLYSSTNPIQTGVVSGTIQLQRAAVLRGRVVGPDGSSMPGVRTTIAGHPEHGQTLSRLDRM